MNEFAYIDLLLMSFGALSIFLWRPAAVVLALSALVHNQFYTDTPVEVYYRYYVADAWLTVAAMVVICVFLRPTKTATAIVYVCFASLMLNVYACIMWYNFVPHADLYNVAFFILYILAILITLRGDKIENEEHNFVFGKHGFFGASCGQSLAVDGALPKEARP